MSSPEEEAGLIGWELMAMANTGHRLRSDRSLRDDAVAHTAFMDSYLTHVRVLTEFFMGRIGTNGKRSWKQRTDLVPQDLLPTWSPPTFRAAVMLDQALPKIDAFLSHLSRRRLDDSEAWGFTNLADAVLSVGAEFDKALSTAASRHGPHFHVWLFLAAQVLAKGPIEKVVLPAAPS